MRRLPVVATVHDVAWLRVQAHAPAYARYYFGRVFARRYRRRPRASSSTRSSRAANCCGLLAGDTTRGACTWCIRASPPISVRCSARRRRAHDSDRRNGRAAQEPRALVRALAGSRRRAPRVGRAADALSAASARRSRASSASPIASSFAATWRAPICWISTPTARSSRCPRTTKASATPRRRRSAPARRASFRIAARCPKSSGGDAPVAAGGRRRCVGDGAAPPRCAATTTRVRRRARDGAIARFAWPASARRMERGLRSAARQ